jgi:acetylglutamate kinase
MNSIPSVAALRAALPYLQLFRNQLFVVKCGGEALETPALLRGLVEQIALLHQVGIRVILVHGGGKQASDLGEKLGIASAFVDGRRVTSKEQIGAMVMSLNGTAQATILATFRELGLGAAGVSGIDAGLILAERKPPIETTEGVVDFGEVGKIAQVNGQVLHALMNDDLVPVVSPLSADAQGRLLNINADDVAAAIAVSLGAKKLILLTQPRGILADIKDPQTLLSQLTLAELSALEENGTIQTGMMPKAGAIRAALEGGVERVHVVSFAFPDALLTEVFTNEGCGTMIVRGDV